MKRIKTLLKYMKGQKRYLLMSIIAVAIATYFMIQTPFVMRFAIDSAIGMKEPESAHGIIALMLRFESLATYQSQLWLVGLFLVTTTLLRGIFLFFKAHFAAKGSEAVALNMRNRLYSHIQSLPYAYHVQAKTGDLIQRCTSDVDTIRRFLGTQFVEIGGVIFLMTMIIGAMLQMHPLLTLISTMILPLGAVFSILFFNRINKVFTVVDEQEGKLSTLIQENLSGVRVVRAFGRQAHELERFNRENDIYSDKIYDLIKEFARYWSSQDLLVLTQTGIMVVAGTYFAVRGEITLGTFVAFSTLASYLLWPVRTLGRIISEMSKSFVAIDRIEEILMIPSEYVEGGLVTDLKGDIVFDHVTFSYEGSDRDVLKDINLTIKQGQTVAILGPTGAGKSTLIHLLARFYDPTKGSIRINGFESTTLEKHNLRRHVAVVLQEPFLFARNISENIRIAKVKATQQDVERAAEAAQIHENIMGFDKGYNTMVGEKGVSLSGGQKQRVSIARKLITDAPVLVFDDSLSAVDTETDAAIRARLKSSNKGLTTIIISHRIATLSEADVIVVLENGAITQMGTHDELSQKEGLYRKVWEIQDAGVLQKIS